MEFAEGMRTFIKRLKQSADDESKLKVLSTYKHMFCWVTEKCSAENNKELEELMEKLAIERKQKSYAELIQIAIDEELHMCIYDCIKTYVPRDGHVTDFNESQTSILATCFWIYINMSSEGSELTDKIATDEIVSATLKVSEADTERILFSRCLTFLSNVIFDKNRELNLTYSLVDKALCILQDERQRGFCTEMCTNCDKRLNIQTDMIQFFVSIFSSKRKQEELLALRILKTLACLLHEPNVKIYSLALTALCKASDESVHSNLVIETLIEGHVPQVCSFMTHSDPAIVFRAQYLCVNLMLGDSSDTEEICRNSILTNITMMLYSGESKTVVKALGMLGNIVTSRLHDCVFIYDLFPLVKTCFYSDDERVVPEALYFFAKSFILASRKQRLRLLESENSGIISAFLESVHITSLYTQSRDKPPDEAVLLTVFHGLNYVLRFLVIYLEEGRGYFTDSDDENEEEETEIEDDGERNFVANTNARNVLTNTDWQDVAFHVSELKEKDFENTTLADLIDRIILFLRKLEPDLEFCDDHEDPDKDEY